MLYWDVFIVMLAQSLSLISGYAGMISLAHASFYGIGAYCAAILSVDYGWPFSFILIIAIFTCGLLAVIISFISIRTVDDYFIIITLGIQTVIFSTMNNWQGLTQGPNGIPGIPTILIAGVGIDDKISFLMLTLIFVSIIWYLLNNITRSPFGRILIALSGDEIFTQSLGKNVFKAKVLAFSISAMFAAVPGVLFAYYTSYIDPTSFTLNESIFILSIVIIGGMKNLRYISIAAASLVLLTEALRFIGLPQSLAPNIRQLLYGIALIVVIVITTNESSNSTISMKAK